MKNASVAKYPKGINPDEGGKEWIMNNENSRKYNTFSSHDETYLSEDREQVLFYEKIWRSSSNSARSKAGQIVLHKSGSLVAASLVVSTISRFIKIATSSLAALVPIINRGRIQVYFLWILRLSPQDDVIVKRSTVTSIVWNSTLHA